MKLSQKDHNLVPRNVLLLPISRFVFQIMFAFLGGIKVSGAEHIPHRGGALLCPNHISDFDPVATLVAVKRNDFNALGKSDLFNIRILGWYLRNVGALSIHRDSADRGALRMAETVVRAGRLLLIFPEGRCSQSGELQNLQPGAMMISLKTGVPIIPIGIRGTNNVLPYGALWPKYGTGGAIVRVGHALHPLRYNQLPRKAALAKYADDLREQFLKLTDVLP